MLEGEEELGVTEEAVETPSTTTETEGNATETQGTEQPAPQPETKTYTEEEVNQRIQTIMHERTRNMSEELNMYRSFGSPQQLFEKIKSVQTAPQPTATEPQAELSAEDKEFLSYMEKKVPGWKKMQEMAAKWDQLQDRLQYVDTLKNYQGVQLEQFTKESVGAFDTICKKYGVPDGPQKVALEETVANLVKSDPALITKYQRGDLSYVQDAFGKVAGMLGMKEKSAVTSTDAHTKIAALPKGMPKGGMSTAITKSRKMSDDERTDMAFKALKGD